MYQKLVLLFLKENFSIKRLMGFDMKKHKTKAILIGIAIVYALAAFLGTFGYLFFDLGKILNEMGQIDLLLSFLIIYSLGLSVMIVLFRANGYLFYYKDYDILAPLPIHSRTIMLAKTTVLLIMVYASTLIFTLPILFSYFYWGGFGIVSLLIYLILFIFIPLVPVAVVSMISLLIALATSRFKKSKILSIIIMFAAFMGIFMVSFSLNDVESNPLTGQIDMLAGLSDIYPPIAWFMKAISEQSFLDLFFIVATHGLLFFLFIMLVQKIVHYTNQRGLRQNIKKSGAPVLYQEKSLLQSLIQKEFRKFFSIPLYALNSGFGSVMLIVLSVASLFYRSQIEDFLVQTIGVDLDIEILILVFIGFCVAMTYTTAISLSLEGKNFWIMKSLPIKPETVVFSKIVFNVLLILPIAMISIVLLGITLGFGLLTQVILILLISVFTFVISGFGAIVNLIAPKFDFKNDIEVIKQSAGALLGVFGGFLLMALNGLVYYLLAEELSFEIIAALLILLNLILLAPIYYFIKTKSQVLFSKMKA